MPSTIDIVCHACVARFESGPDATLNDGGDAVFRVRVKAGIVTCPRCGSRSVALVDRKPERKS